ncbi:MAG: hypothetical protein HY301_09810 [Verrucomicrobia bacterium]|nr:hypothetical protein [Verrucomicrobiota bacterium]
MGAITVPRGKGQRVRCGENKHPAPGHKPIRIVSGFISMTNDVADSVTAMSFGASATDKFPHSEPPGLTETTCDSATAPFSIAATPFGDTAPPFSSDETAFCLTETPFLTTVTIAVLQKAAATPQKAVAATKEGVAAN